MYDGRMSRILACLLIGVSLAGRVLGSSQSPLEQAAREGDVERAKNLLAQGQSQYGRDSALRCAIRAGHREVTELLISHGARYALMIATEEGDAEFVKHLLAQGQEANARDSALHAAARTGHAEIMELLLSSGTDANAVRWGNLTPLFFAVTLGRDFNALSYFTNFPLSPASDRSIRAPRSSATPEAYVNIVRLLISRGADVNLREKQNGFVPLHFAILGGNGEIVETLLDHGAEVNPRMESAHLSNRYIAPLHLAAHYGDLAICELLIRRRADVNAKMPPETGIWMSNARQTPLHHAVCSGNAKLVELLIEHGSEVNAADSEDVTPLHLAAERGDRSIVRVLLAHGAEVNVVDREGQTPLHHAAGGDDPTIVLMLLSHGPDLDRKTGEGQTPLSIAVHEGRGEIVKLLMARMDRASLHTAASMGDTETMARLIDSGVTINRIDMQERTALHAAVAAGQVSAVRWLLAHGADPNWADDENATPLRISLRIAQDYCFSDDPNEVARYDALKSKQRQILPLVVEYGAMPDFRYGIPPKTVRARSEKVADLLVEAGVNLEPYSDSKATLLHRAAWWGKKGAVAELIALGADINAADGIGGTPLHAALQSGSTRYWDVILGPRENVLRVLLEHGAHVDAANNGGMTPLHGAAARGNVNIVKLLIEHGADVNAAGSGNRTALHYAAKRGSVDVVSLLIAKGADINAKDNEGDTPLLLLLSSDSLMEDEARRPITDFALLLVRKGVEIDMQNAQGVTPLQQAAGLGFPDFLEELLTRGASVNRQSTTGWTALHSAVTGGNAECVDMLLKHDARVDVAGRLPDMVRLPRFSWPARMPLHIAASHGNDSVVKLLIAAGADVNAPDGDGKTPLYLAYEQDHPSTVKLLLDNEADSNTRAPNGTALVYVAAGRQRRDMVDMLLQHGARADAALVEALLETGLPPLYEAAKQGDVERVRSLLDDAMKAGMRDYPIHLAAAARHVEVVELLAPQASPTALTSLLYDEVSRGHHELIPLLVAHGADVNARERIRQEAPLHQAVGKHNVKAIESLLAQGANINSVDKNNETPLGAAVYRGQRDVVALLLSRGADVDTVYTGPYPLEGGTPLHVAVQRNDVEIAEMLVSKGADVNRSRKSGTTPLHMAIGNQRLFEFMLRHGGQIDSRSRRGRTPLHWAVESGQAAFAQYLVERGASTDIQDDNGNTPLHLAAKKGRNIVCRMLLDHKADITIRNKKGLLPLDYAEASGMRDLMSDLTPRVPQSISTDQP